MRIHLRPLTRRGELGLRGRRLGLCTLCLPPRTRGLGRPRLHLLG